MGHSSGLRKLFAPGLLAVRQNWPPIVVIQVVAVCLLCMYYGVSAFHQGLDQLARMKDAGGLAASAIISAIAGGIVPEIAKSVTGRIRRYDWAWIEKTAWTALIYGLLGITVALLYRTQTYLFGSSRDLRTLTCKTSLDMLGYTPFFSIPFACTMLAFYEARYRWKTLAAALRDSFFAKRVIPSLVSCWAFWIPVLYCVYAFPLPIQFLIAMLAQAAWVVIFVFMNTPDAEAAA